MLHKTVLFIALRYMCSKTADQFDKCIYWISSVAIMLGVMILIIVLSVMNGFEQNLKENILYFTPHALLTTVHGYTHIDNIPNLKCDELRGIESIQPVIMSDVILQSTKKISLGSMLGINPNYFEPLSNYLINSDITQLSAGEYNVILGSALARSLEVNINDKIRLIIPTIVQMTPVGSIPSQRLFTVSDIYITNGDIDDYQIIVHQVDASHLMHYSFKQYITGWRLWFYDPFIINDSYRLFFSNNWIWKDWREYKGSIFQAMKIEKNVMSLLLSLIIVAACFNVMSFLILLIMNKQIEIAILKTYGFTRKHIMWIFMFQGMSNGIFGIVSGISLGILLSQKLNKILYFFNILPDTLKFPIVVQSDQILMITIITFIVIVLITLYPAWHAASVQPAKILHRG